MRLTRRAFLKQGAAVMLGLGAAPGFLARTAAAASGAKRKILLVLFQQGAADGLAMVAPFAEPSYYSLRPTLAVPAPKAGSAEAALDLDGFFGLHPTLKALQPLFQNGRMAIVHAAGSPDDTLSHFDAQDYMECGTPGVRDTEDGWMNRSLRVNPREGATSFRGVAIAEGMPRILQGPASAVALPNVSGFMSMGDTAGSDFEALYSRTPDALLGSAGRQALEAARMLRKSVSQPYAPQNGAVYPEDHLGPGLQQLAQLIKADVGVEMAFLNGDGWDTHRDQNSPFTFPKLLLKLGAALAAFQRDLGDRMEDIVIVTMSEFGRTARENGNKGTDHGHANCMFVMGGPVRGGKVYGRWPGLEPGQLHRGRDLAVTTDFRLVLGELIDRHLGYKNLGEIFPGYACDRGNFLGLLKA